MCTEGGRPIIGPGCTGTITSVDPLLFHAGTESQHNYNTLLCYIVRAGLAIACGPRGGRPMIGTITSVDPLLFAAVARVNYFTEMCSGSEEGSYLRLIDFCITQL